MNPLSRAYPDFLIIGAQRSGTSSLYRYLAQHPHVIPSLRKETEYFSSRYHLGDRWYRAHFPIGIRRRIRQAAFLKTFEATPDYLLHPAAAARAAATIPAARIIVLLRDPVARAFSHYHHMVRLGFEQLSFEEALEAEAERIQADLERSLADSSYRPLSYLRYSYVERGHYAEQLQNWMKSYPLEQILILESATLYERPQETYERTLTFLDLPIWSPAQFRNYSYKRDAHAPNVQPMRAETEQLLRRHFAPHDDRIADLLGRRPSWSP